MSLREQDGATRAKHYILEGVTDALFLAVRNLGTFELQAKTNADVTPRGVVYTLRSVLRGLTMSSLAHFTGMLYSPAWVFTLSVSCNGFPKTSNSKRAAVKHPRFLYVAFIKVKSN